MPDTITPNYSLIKPEVSGSIDTWGGKLNGNFDILDTRIKTNETVSSNAMQRSSTDVLQRTATNYLFYDTTMPAFDPASQGAGCLMSNGAVRALLNTLMPIGTIILWGGQESGVPWGWALCTGQVVNGHQTPDLRDRFVMASGTTYGAGYRGGTNVMSVNTATGYHVLTLEEMPQHNHAVVDPKHVHNATWNRTSSGYGMTAGSPYYAGDIGRYTTDGINTSSSATGIQVQYNGYSWGHNHPIAFALNWWEYWPQFISLCFIMRVYPF